MKILVVEDEPKTGNYLKQGLAEAGVCRRSRARRQRRAPRRRYGELRPDRARRHAAGARRLVGAAGAARRRETARPFCS